MSVNGALAVQVGGDHYKLVKIQPVQFTEHNGLGFCEGNVIKYLCRSRKKAGLQDVQKAGHYLQLLLQLDREIPGGLPVLPLNYEIKEDVFLAQFPDLTRPERDVIRAINNWRRAPAGMRNRNTNRHLRLADIAREWHNIESAWANSCPVQTGSEQ